MCAIIERGGASCFFPGLSGPAAEVAGAQSRSGGWLKEEAARMGNYCAAFS
jgi:hypothetical protein